MGPDLDTVHRALMASGRHYANMVDPQLTLVGIGVVTSGGRVFVVENFMRPSGAAPPRTVAPTTTVAPAPAPKATAPPPTVTRPPVTTAVPARPATAPAPPPTVPAELSPWLALAIELTRRW